jgi:ketosteroid isomerase-like protein
MMNSTEPKDIVRKFLAAIAAGDGAAMLDRMAEDAVMITPGSPKVPFNGRFEGKASIAHAFTLFAEYLEIRDHTLKLLFGEGEHVAVMINETSRAKRTDRFIKQDTFWYFRVAGGLIVLWQVFEDTEQVGWAWDDGAARRPD